MKYYRRYFWLLKSYWTWRNINFILVVVFIRRCRKWVACRCERVVSSWKKMMLVVRIKPGTFTLKTSPNSYDWTTWSFNYFYLNKYLLEHEKFCSSFRKQKHFTPRVINSLFYCSRDICKLYQKFLAFPVIPREPPT